MAEPVRVLQHADLLCTADRDGDARTRCHGGGRIGQFPFTHHPERTQRLGLCRIRRAACRFRLVDVSTGAFLPSGSGVGSTVRTDVGLESPSILGVRLDMGCRVFRGLPGTVRSHLAGQLTVTERSRVNVGDRSPL